MKTARSCCFLALVLGLALTSHALAQTAEATALYKQGKKLAEDKDWAGACEKFETSERLEPAIGTEMNLGKCHEELGHTASAWSWYQKAFERAKKNDDDRAAAAKQRVVELEKKLVHLTVHVPSESEVDGLVVKLNERELERGEWNQELPIDPDKYTVTAEAPGRKPWSDSVTLKSKDREIEVPKLARAHARGPKTHEPEPEHDALANKNQGLTIALGGFGIGAVAIATGFAIYSKSLENEADVLCPMKLCKDSHGVDLNHSARLDGWIANVGWLIGAGSIAGAGIAWYLGQPDGVTVAPVVDGDRAGVVIGGRF
jgi:tetratricopeptide (TPR) repeat protein